MAPACKVVRYGFSSGGIFSDDDDRPVNFQLPRYDREPLRTAFSGEIRDNHSGRRPSYDPRKKEYVSDDNERFDNSVRRSNDGRKDDQRDRRLYSSEHNERFDNSVRRSSDGERDDQRDRRSYSGERNERFDNSVRRSNERGGKGRGKGGGERGQGNGKGRGSDRPSYDSSGGISRGSGGGRFNTGKSEWEEGSYIRRQRSSSFEERHERNQGMDYLYGISPVLNALLSQKRGQFGELLLQDRSVSKSALSKALMNEVSAITKLAQELNIPIEHVSKHDLNMLSENRPHQGVVLAAPPITLSDITELPSFAQQGDGELKHTDSGKDVWLALDEVVDPQNLGALLRSACFLGAKGVVVCTKNSAALSPVVSKASAGALEIGNLFQTNNMAKFLNNSAGNGWKVVGTCMGGEGIPLKELSTEMGPTVVVLGNEGHGLRFVVEKACTTMVNIPTGVSLERCEEVADERSMHSGVSSLNVAVSGGIVLYQLLS